MSAREFIVPLLAGLVLASTATVVARDGLPIIFSGRDGRSVRFNFSRQKALVPPEMKESRRAISDPAAFIPLVDPSVSPNSGASRRQLNRERSGRDWIFQETDSGPAEEKTDRSKQFAKPEPKESAMLRYMRGDQATDARSVATDGEVPDNDNLKRDQETTQDDRFNFGGSKDKGLSISTGKRESFWSRIEGAAGLDAPAERMTLKNFFALEENRESELRHREKMSEFRAKLGNPFADPASGPGMANPGAPGSGSLPGVSVSFGPNRGGPTKPGLPGGNFGPVGGLPNAFDTRKVPAGFGDKSALSNPKPEPIRRGMNLDIPKRDF